MSVAVTLSRRETQYGDYTGVAQLAQALKSVMRDSPNWSSCNLTEMQMESLDMIANKLARILNGNPDFSDSWHDVAGYATLVETDLVNQQREIALERKAEALDEEATYTYAGHDAY